MTSERVNSLSWPAEVFYRRLMSAVDDFGRFWAKPDLLRAALYPLQLEKVGNSNVAKWLAECAGAGLVRAYTVEKKEYLQLIDFRQQVRAQMSKFPQMPSDAQQMHSECLAPAHLDGDVVEDEDVGGKTVASSAPALSAGNGAGLVYIPLNDGSEYPVLQADVDELGKLYPALDVVQTLKEIRGWNLGHPKRRKTKGGVMAHVHSWFAKEQNKAPA